MNTQFGQTLANAEVLATAGDLTGALELLSSASSADAAEAARLDVAKAGVLVRMDAYDRALELVLAAADVCDDEIALLNLGIAFYNSGRLRDSIEINERIARRGLKLSGAAEDYKLRSLLQLDEPLDNVRAALASWSARFVEPSLVPRQRRRLTARDNRPLQVGFVGSFLKSPVYWAALVPVFRSFDLQRIRATVYSFAPGDAPAWVKGSVYNWRDLAANDEGAASLIRADRNDILVDLDGMVGNFIKLFAARPAPITVSWYNVLGSIPAPVFDYVLVDRVVVPEAERADWAESVVTMPHTYFCMRPLDVRPVPGPAPITQLGYPTLGSFNRPSKLGNATVESWIRILKAVPSARLRLSNIGYDAPGARDAILSRLAEDGIEPSRVHIQGSLDGDLFLKAYEKVDLALDPFPFNGGTTTFDALWQGVPVVGFPGDRLSARVTASILRTAGLDELVAPNLPEAEALIVALANDPARLAGLRAVVAERIRKCPFSDPVAFAGALTDVFDAMFAERWASQSAGARP